MALNPTIDTARFWRGGLVVRPAFLGSAEAAHLIGAIDAYRHGHELPVVSRPGPGRALRYQVIDGYHFPEAVPGADALVARIQAEVDRTCGPPLTLIDDVRAACNVNITPPHGEYRWHYDRNQVTALLYLNQVRGGETELHSNYRVLAPGALHVQELLDGLLRSRAVRALHGRARLVAPAVGTLVILRGDRTLHSVRPVAGPDDRINLVIAFDRPDTRHHRAALDHYLYDSSGAAPVDRTP